MGIGISIFLIAVGAVLSFAVNATVEGVNLDTVGIILMVVGAIGLLASLTFWGDWGPARRNADREVIREREYL